MSELSVEVQSVDLRGLALPQGEEGSINWVEFTTSRGVSYEIGRTAITSLLPDGGVSGVQLRREIEGDPNNYQLTIIVLSLFKSWLAEARKFPNGLVAVTSPVVAVGQPAELNRKLTSEVQFISYYQNT